MDRWDLTEKMPPEKEGEFERLLYLTQVYLLSVLAEGRCPQTCSLPPPLPDPALHLLEVTAVAGASVPRSG